jgi:hypothetical protein
MKLYRYQTKNGYDKPRRCALLHVDGHIIWFADDLFSWDYIIKLICIHVSRRKLTAVHPQEVSRLPIEELSPKDYRELLDSLAPKDRAIIQNRNFSYEGEVSSVRGRQRCFGRTKAS